jgi:hypothetical protein
MGMPRGNRVTLLQPNEATEAARLAGTVLAELARFDSQTSRQRCFQLNLDGYFLVTLLIAFSTSELK